MFNILPGRKFEFLVNSKPGTEGAWTIDLEPLTGAAMSNLHYERWVEDRKQMVAKLTNGEIGYLHIKAMDGPSHAKFQRDLLENQDKKCLISTNASTEAAASIRNCYRYSTSAKPTR